MKYARWERERKFVLDGLPPDVGAGVRIVDHYLHGYRLRLRRVEHADRTTFKLGQKYRPDPATPADHRMTTLYLEEAEYAALLERWDLGVPLIKWRHPWTVGERRFIVDRFDPPFAQLCLAEIEHSDGEVSAPPPGALREATHDGTLDGGVLAALAGGLRDDALAVVALQRQHFPHLARWRSDPAVNEWYGGRDDPLDLPKVEAKFGPRLGRHEDVACCVVELEHRPIGYLQFYSVADFEAYATPPGPATFAIDLFIGESDQWGKGLGRRALLAVLQMLDRVAGARRVLIDPHVRNVRAQRSYAAAGFRPVRVLADHEVHEGKAEDALLMCWTP